MMAAGVEMQQHHTEPTLLRVGDDNLCAISLGKEDEEFADTLRMAVALTSHVALLRAVRLRTIVIYITESELDPSELLVHPFSQTVTEAGELGGNIGHNMLRRTAMGLPPTTPAMTGVQAEDEDELELNYEENDNTMGVDTAQRGAAEAPCLADITLDSPQRSIVHRTFREGTPEGTTERLVELQHLTTATTKLLAQSSPASKGKAAASAKHKKKQPRGRSHSCGTTRNRSMSKPRLSGTHDTDNE
eukprot:jgi/Tetstr1/454854/TSEL_004042.t1